MLISLWNYLRGYVKISVSGFSAERFMNLAVHKGVFIWDVAFGQDDVTMNVSVKAFRLLKSCARKTGCRVRILEKRGCPFKAHRYRKRKLLVAGVFGFVLALYAMSLFVWLVDVTGAEKLSSHDIVSFFADNGLKAGTFKPSVSEKSMEGALMRAFPDIAWVNIHIKGTRATIRIKEALPKQIMVDRQTPCDVVAVKDGLIVGVATSAGTPLVKRDDVVKEGDVLVAGELVVKNDETGVLKEYVHASAEVLAKRYTEINFKIPFAYTEKQFTGNTKSRLSLRCFGYEFPLPGGKMAFESFQKSVREKKLGVGNDYPLPITFITTTYREFVPVQKIREPEQVKELAERMVTGRIVREFDFSADVVDKKTEFVEGADETLVYCVVTTVEDIGAQKIIDMSALESQNRDEENMNANTNE